MSLRALLTMRARLVRKLTHPNLPQVLLEGTRLNGMEGLIELDDTMAAADRLDLPLCMRRAAEGQGGGDAQPAHAQNVLGHTVRSIHMLMATICMGILEEEEAARTGQHAYLDGAVGISVIAKFAWRALRGLLACPWDLSGTAGWPVFFLLARFLRQVRATSESRALVCPAEPTPLADFLELVGRQGAPGVPELPPRSLSLSLPEAALRARSYWTVKAVYNPEALAEAICFWEAADRRAIPAGPVCVHWWPQPHAVPHHSVAEGLGLSSRECNARWPACDSNLTGWPGAGAATARSSTEAPVRFWMQLPRRRDVAADAVREEQRPYCTLNHQGVLVGEVERALARDDTPGRPLDVVEVGSTFGDCALLARALAERRGARLRVLSFEPNPQVLPLLEANLRLNARPEDDMRARGLVVSSRGGSMRPLLVPGSGSSVHAVAEGDHIGERANFRALHSYMVNTTTLDAELGEEPFDLLLLSVNNFETEIVAGAHRVLSKRLPRAVVTMTRYFRQYRRALQAHGYAVKVLARAGPDVWSVAHPTPRRRLLRRRGRGRRRAAA